MKNTINLISNIEYPYSCAQTWCKPLPYYFLIETTSLSHQENPDASHEQKCNKIQLLVHSCHTTL